MFSISIVFSLGLLVRYFLFFFKQKTAYEMRISDWSSDVCSSDLTKAKSAHDMNREYSVQKALKPVYPAVANMVALCHDESVIGCEFYVMDRIAGLIPRRNMPAGVQLTAGQTRQLCRSEEHTSELQSLMRNSYAVFCLKKKNEST